MSFHICWEDPSSVSPLATGYRIMNSHYTELYRTPNDMMKYSVDVDRQYSNTNSVLIQALSTTSLPSKLFSVNISGK